MPALTIIINVRDGVTPGLQAVRAALRSEQFMAVLGAEGVRVLQRHFRERDRTHANKLGGQRTHFWADAANSTHSEPKENGFKISINKEGVRQRLEGGIIRAGTRTASAQFLTIPISPVSYGHRASEFPGLFLVKTKKGAFLVQVGEEEGAKGEKKRGKDAGGYARKRTKAKFNFLFILRRFVNQGGDPTVLPEEGDLLDPIGRRGQLYLRRIWAEAEVPPPTGGSDAN